MRLTSLLLVIATSLAAATSLPAQDDGFSPVIQVNDSVITGYEMQQRIKFLELLRFQGDIPAEAERGLIDDRLRLQVATESDIVVTPEQLQAGMAEFAARANLDTEKFLAAIGEGGVDTQTFRDFVRAGLAWRALVNEKFGSRVSVSEAEIDRALSSDFGRGAGPQVLLSEIILPAAQGGFRPAIARAEELAASIKTEADFAAAARENSVAASRAQGGKLDWMPITNLPPAARAVLSKVAQGQVSPPVMLSNGVALFQLRGFREGTTTVQPSEIRIDFVQFFLPSGIDTKAELARIRSLTDNCDDLYEVANGLPANQLQRQKTLRGKIPSSTLAVLDRLDPNEMTLIQGNNGTASLLMLCSRTATYAELGTDVEPVVPVIGRTADGDIIPSVAPDFGFGLGPSRSQVREEIISMRIAQLSDAYLAQLRADAIIRRP